jgi:prepilin-type N-terminal cleavage/methylation domain-containing protein
MGSQRGMTLIELMAAIAIIMLVVALALPNLAGMLNAQRWTAATSALQNALRRCRAWAISERRDHAVEICTDPEPTTATSAAACFTGCRSTG